jgi:hypothetical protein
MQNISRFFEVFLLSSVLGLSCKGGALSSSEIQIHPDVVSRTLEGEEVLLQLETGAYFGLNEVGTIIWKSLQAGHSKDQILAQLEKIYAVPVPEAERDFDDLLGHLKMKGLILS